METVVAVAQHRNQYYSQRKSRVANQFVSSPSKGFVGINCRSFESCGGILPTLPKPIPLFGSHNGPKSSKTYSEPPEPSKRSNPIPISAKPTTKGRSFNEDVEEFSYSELWAGPAYSNSPPPSSLPIPKFSLRQKRSVSLELPLLPPSDIDLPNVSKSAPSSPTRDFFSSATEDLRRILNLDISDD